MSAPLSKHARQGANGPLSAATAGGRFVLHYVSPATSLVGALCGLIGVYCSDRPFGLSASIPYPRWCQLARRGFFTLLRSRLVWSFDHSLEHPRRIGRLRKMVRAV